MTIPPFWPPFNKLKRNYVEFCVLPLRLPKTKVAFLLLAFCFLLFHPSASAQRFIGGVAAGINFTQVAGDGVKGYHKIGFNGGPYVKLMLDQKQRFSLTMELLYTQKGASSRSMPFPYFNNGPAYVYAIDDTLHIDENYPDVNNKYFYKLRADYLEIPLLVHFEDPRSKVGIGVGISWSRLVYIKEIQQDYRISDSSANGSRRLTTSVANLGQYKKNEWAVIVDAKFPIYKGLKLNVRFQYSIVPFGRGKQFYSHLPSENMYDSKLLKPYHNSLTVRLIYSFNEKYMENDNFDRSGKRIGPRWIRDPEAMRW